MSFPELLKLCLNVNLDISDEQIKQTEKDTSTGRKNGFTLNLRRTKMLQIYVCS